jgi:hypothetical protein
MLSTLTELGSGALVGLMLAGPICVLLFLLAQGLCFSLQGEFCEMPGLSFSWTQQ